MGGAMAGRLARHGFAVTVHNRTAARAQDLATAIGASVASTPREAVAGASTVVVSLADDAAVRSAYSGPDGLGAGVSPDAVVLETSTIAPATVRSLLPLVGQATLLDAPVSGSVPIVERGELTFLVGGPAEAVERARPVLDVLGSKVFTLGPLGSGATMKLAVNAVVHGLNQALSEALVLAERAGVDRATAYEVFAASAVAAPFVHYKRNSFVDPEATPVAFMLELVAKDLALIEDLATEVGARMDQVSTNRRIVEESLREGYGSRDLSAIADLLRR
jgi:3-hydroxyisobutyrate dehydrogenase-like beta-hydroxyacid dehydrogenase